MLRVDSIETPLGVIHLAERDGALVVLQFDRPLQGERGRCVSTAALRDYFAGDPRALDALPAAPEGTPFQKRVWAALREIPAGRTWSYGQLARRVGSHPRAVGGANGANPVALVIPCHRVIASDGTLCGYGGGLDRKRWLLDHERPAASARSLHP
jgi:methylated-DNA-[protein]-cysteine S-methyltransferase